MSTSCAVIRDLLPLYAEDLASEESKALVEEHLRGCPDCRRRLEELKTPATPAPDGAAALRAVKKDIRRKRLTAVLLAALLVFLPLFALLARSTDKVPLDYSEGMIAIERITDQNESLVLNCYGPISGVSDELVTDDETGESTLFLQLWTNRFYMATHNGKVVSLGTPDDTSVKVFYPVPDRVIYGFGEKQTLLYGEPMNGGVQILPRLALSAYLYLASALALIFGILWLLLRKKKGADTLRIVFFAELSYPVGHLLVKGTQTASFSLPRDLACILLAAAAVWGLLMLLPIRNSECGIRN